MIRAIVLATFLTLISASESLAEGAEATNDLSCFRSLVLPTTGLLAARASESGTVRAFVEIGETGALTRLDLEGNDPLLKGEVQVALTVSKFDPSCRNRTIQVEFSFILEDPPTAYILPPVVKFSSPNRFTLVFRRVMASLDPAPSGKASSPMRPKK